MVDQLGKVVTGLTIAEDDELPKLEVYSDVATSTSLQMHQAANQLRSMQADEVHDFARTELAKSGPSGLRALSVLTKESLSALVERKKAEIAQRDQSKEPPKPTPEPPPPQKEERSIHALLDSPGRSGAEEGSGEEATLKRKAVQWGKAPKAKAPRSKQKPQNRKAGREGGKGQQSKGAQHFPSPKRAAAKVKASSPQAACAAGHGATAPTLVLKRPKEEPAEDDGSVMDPSQGDDGVRRRVSGKKSSVSSSSLSNEEKTRLAIETLNIQDALMTPEKSWGNELYQTKRALTAMLKTSPHCAPVVLLSSHMERFRAVTELAPGKLPNLSKDERKRLLAVATAEGTEVVEWPLDFQCVFVSLRVRETMAELRAGTYEVWSQDMWDLVAPQIEEGQPAASRAAFDPERAGFRDCVFGDDIVSLAKVWSRLVVAEVLVPLVSQGLSTKKHLGLFIDKCLNCGAAPGSSGPAWTKNPAWQSALKMVRGCCSSLRLFLCPDDFENLGFSNLDSLMKSKDSCSMKGVLRAAILRSPDFRKLESEIRTHQLATTQYGPSVAKAKAGLDSAMEKKEGILPELERVCADLPQWLSALRPGATHDLEASFVMAMNWHMDSIVDGETAKLEEFAKLLSTLVSKWPSSAVKASCSVMY